jgi:hypothetical protein
MFNTHKKHEIITKVVQLLIQGSFSGKMIHLIDLVDNPLRYIDSEAFSGLEGLLYLRISRNFLAAFDTPSTNLIKLL